MTWVKEKGKKEKKKEKKKRERGRIWGSCKGKRGTIRDRKNKKRKRKRRKKKEEIRLVGRRPHVSVLLGQFKKEI